VDFWTLTERAIDFAFARVPSVDRALRLKLLDAYMELDAYPDTRPTLTGLKARGARIAILSNGSPNMLGAAVQSAGIAGLCEALLSVDTVRMYKPRPEAYELVRSRFGIKPQDAVFVSSNRWDIMGAARFGFRPAWINRSEMPDEYKNQPSLPILRDLSALLSLKI
jgi:2-haloacid dehalogenase